MAISSLMPHTASLGISLVGPYVPAKSGAGTAVSETGEPGSLGTFLRELPFETVRDFSTLGISKAYAAGSLLISEDQPPEYVYFITEGSIKLSIDSPDGHRLTYRVAHKGQIIGMTAVILDRPYDSIAEAVHACQVTSIAKREFFDFLTRHPQAQWLAMKMLSVQYVEICETLRLVSLGANAPRKVARLLLKWSAAGGHPESSNRVRFSMTHEEVGEFVGASRETITRTLTKFRQDNIIEMHGSMMTISNKLALEKIAGS